MSFLGNVLWFLMGGVLTGLLWWLFGALAFVSILGIPWGRACFVMGGLAFRPFGREAIRRDLLTGRQDVGTSWPGVLGNVIWFLLAGLWIAGGHLAAALACAVTIVGIPFAWQHMKLAALALCPIGQTVVPAEVAALVRRRQAETVLDTMRSRA